MDDEPRLRLRGKVWHVCIGRNVSRSLKTADRRVALIRAREYVSTPTNKRVAILEAKVEAVQTVTVDTIKMMTKSAKTRNVLLDEAADAVGTVMKMAKSMHAAHDERIRALEAR